MLAPVLNFAQLLVLRPTERAEATQQAVVPRDLKSFASEYFHGVGRLVVGEGIKSPQDGRLLTCDTDHPAEPARTNVVAIVEGPLDVSQKGVVVALESLMIPGLPTEVKNQLQRPHDSDRQADIGLTNSKSFENIPNRSGPKDNYDEVEYPVPSLQGPASCCVIESVSQDVEADVFAIGNHSYFFGGGGAEGIGCLGPTLVPGPDGCLGPRERSIITGCRTPMELTPDLKSRRSTITAIRSPSLLLVIRIVLDLSLRSRMKASASVRTAGRCRHNIMCSSIRKAQDWLSDHPDFGADLAGAAILTITAWLIFVIAACLG